MQRPTIIIILTCCLAATGCIDLKGISTFSSASAHTLVTINNLSYGYASYIADSCYINKEKPRNFNDFLCDSTRGKLFDSSLSQEFVVLANYFAALAKLAGSSELINAGPLGTAVVAGTYGKFTITSQEAQIAGGLSKGISDILNLRIKSKHVSEVLQKYGADVNKYIGFLALHLNNLEGDARSVRDEIKFKTMLKVNSSSSDTDRFILFSLYKEKRESLDKVIAENVSKQQMIQKILEGHQQLVEQASDLKSKSLKKKLLTLVANIAYISNK